MSAAWYSNTARSCTCRAQSQMLNPTSCNVVLVVPFANDSLDPSHICSPQNFSHATAHLILLSNERSKVLYPSCQNVHVISTVLPGTPWLGCNPKSVSHQSLYIDTNCHNPWHVSYTIKLFSPSGSLTSHKSSLLKARQERHQTATWRHLSRISIKKKNKWLFDLRRLWTLGKRISMRSFKSIKSHLLVSLWKRLTVSSQSSINTCSIRCPTNF